MFKSKFQFSEVLCVCTVSCCSFGFVEWNEVKKVPLLFDIATFCISVIRFLHFTYIFSLGCVRFGEPSLGGHSGLLGTLLNGRRAKVSRSIIYSHRGVRTNFVKDICCSAQVVLQHVASLSFQLSKPDHSGMPPAPCFTAGVVSAESWAQTQLADPELVYFSSVIISLLCVCVLADGNRKAKADRPLDVKPTLQSTASLKVSCWPVDQPVAGGLNRRTDGGRVGNQMNHLEHNPFPVIYKK